MIFYASLIIVAMIISFGVPWAACRIEGGKIDEQKRQDADRDHRHHDRRRVHRGAGRTDPIDKLIMKLGEAS